MRHRPPFLGTHGSKVLEGLLEDRLNQRPVIFKMASVAARFGHHAGQCQHLGEQHFAAVGQIQLVADVAQLAKVASQCDGVDAEVLGSRGAFAAQMHLQGAALDLLTDDFFEVRLEQMVGVVGAERYLEIAVVDRASGAQWTR